MTARKNNNIVVVIIAGGAGKRFWPLSTPRRPKQFLTEFSDLSLFQQSVLRAQALAPPERILVMTNCDFGPMVRRQAPQLPKHNIILEPCRRDTGPAIALAATVVANRWPDSVMAVTPADHLIKDKTGFKRTVEAAAERARQGGLVTIGIKPHYPATGFGYLQLVGKPGRDPKALRLRRFVEKPEAKRAASFVKCGNYLWNAGIFVWRTDTIIEEIKRHMPDCCRLLSGLTVFKAGAAFQKQVAEIFKRVKPISIDYGVMEKARQVWAVPAAFGWSDVGGWLAVRELMSPDKKGNCLRGSVISSANSDCVLISNDPHDVVLCAGLKDVVVVNTPHGTLVCHKDAAESIKPFVDDILKK